MKTDERLQNELERVEHSIATANKMIMLALVTGNEAAADHQGGAKSQMVITSLVLQWMITETEMDMLPWIAQNIQKLTEKYSLEAMEDQLMEEIGSFLGGTVTKMKKNQGAKEDDSTEQPITLEEETDPRIADFKNMVLRNFKNPNQKTNLN